MPYTSDSWTFGHVPTTFKRLPTVNRWGVLHGFYSDQRDDQELSNSAPDMPSRVGFRILANRSIWRFPNSSGILRVIDGTYGVFSSESTGVFKVIPGTNKINVTVSGGYQGDNHANFDLSGGNSIYGASSTVQPKTMRGYWLIRF